MIRKFVFIFFILVFFVANVQAIEWKDSTFGEYPFVGDMDMIIPIDDEATSLAKNEKLKYLKDLYKSNVISTYDGWIVENKYNNSDLMKIYYDKNLKVLTSVKKGNIDIVSIPVFGNARFVQICDYELKKCGLYDAKKKRFSGMEYDNISTSFSGTPILSKDGKYIYVQPFKNIVLSTGLGISKGLETLCFIIFAPFIFIFLV